jgi:hypothetical protein
MPTPPLTPDQRALARDLAGALRADADEFLRQLTEILAGTAPAAVFGAAQTALRDLALRFAARACEQRLRGKKRL